MQVLPTGAMRAWTSSSLAMAVPLTIAVINRIPNNFFMWLTAFSSLV
jgi:hypothetical protein